MTHILWIDIVCHSVIFKISSNHVKLGERELLFSFHVTFVHLSSQDHTISTRLAFFQLLFFFGGWISWWNSFLKLDVSHKTHKTQPQEARESWSQLSSGVRGPWPGGKRLPRLDFHDAMMRRGNSVIWCLKSWVELPPPRHLTDEGRRIFGGLDEWFGWVG